MVCERVGAYHSQHSIMCINPAILAGGAASIQCHACKLGLPGHSEVEGVSGLKGNKREMSHRHQSEQEATGHSI